MDPIEAELFRNALAAIGDEMVLTIYRTAYSGVLKNIMDYSAAVCDAQGRLVGAGPQPARPSVQHPGGAAGGAARGSATTSPRATFWSATTRTRAGCTCPTSSSSSRCSLTARCIAYAATICHHTDVGGRVPGSNASDSTEIYRRGTAHPAAEAVRAGAAERDPVSHHRTERASAGTRVRRPSQPTRRVRDRRARHGRPRRPPRRRRGGVG